MLRGIAHQVGLRLAQLRLIPGELALGLVQLRLERTRIDLRQQIARLEVLSLLIGDIDSSPSTRERTVTVFSAVTVPRPLI